MADDPLDRSRTYVAAGVLFFDDTGRILLVQPTYKDHWDIPGGYVEVGETPAQAAAREVRKELGIETSVGPLLVADWAPHPDEGDKLLLIFDGGTLNADQHTAIHLPADELASYAFHDPTETVSACHRASLLTSGQERGPGALIQLDPLAARGDGKPPRRQ